MKEDGRDPQKDNQEILNEPWNEIPIYERQGSFLLLVSMDEGLPDQVHLTAGCGRSLRDATLRPCRSLF